MAVKQPTPEEMGQATDNVTKWTQKKTYAHSRDKTCRVNMGPTHGNLNFRVDIGNESGYRWEGTQNPGHRRTPIESIWKPIYTRGVANIKIIHLESGSMDDDKRSNHRAQKHHITSHNWKEYRGWVYKFPRVAGYGNKGCYVRPAANIDIFGELPRDQNLEAHQ